MSRCSSYLSMARNSTKDPSRAGRDRVSAETHFLETCLPRTDSAGRCRRPYLCRTIPVEVSERRQERDRRSVRDAALDASQVQTAEQSGESLLLQTNDWYAYRTSPLLITSYHSGAQMQDK